ncbi:MAG: hypothetical protein HC906_13525 [Bacteroidales bacterium]|nr:hypothetical protein [Bacteroidales bacterium]
MIDKAIKELEERGEIYFSIPANTSISMQILSEYLSIDKPGKDSIYAYANKKQFEIF